MPNSFSVLTNQRLRNVYIQLFEDIQIPKPDCAMIVRLTSNRKHTTIPLEIPAFTF